MVVRVDLIGLRFGMLTAVEPVGKTPKGRTLWRCICDCGREKIIESISRNNFTSCGNHRRELLSKLYTTHGATNTAEFRIWGGMRNRCYNKADRVYPIYGGRGIVVCDEWKDSFETFLRDMGKRPTSKHSIDRIDSNGPYSANNCRWATSSQQIRNRRNTLFCEYEGRKISLADFYDLKPRAVSFRVFRDRVRSLGWPLEESCAEPKFSVGHHYRPKRTAISKTAGAA